MVNRLPPKGAANACSCYHLCGVGFAKAGIWGNVSESKQ